MADSTGLQTRRWASGRRFAETRPLTQEERDRLDRDRRSSIRQAVALTVGYVVSVFVLVGLAPGLARIVDDSSRIAAALVVPALVGALVWTGIALLGTRDRMVAAAAAARDLAAGAVDVFEFAPAATEVPAPAPAGPALAVTTGTGRAVSGPVELLGCFVPVSEVADGTEGAYRVPSLARVDGADVEQRRLSEGEREEIRLAIARSRRLDSRVILPLAMLGYLGLVTAFGREAKEAEGPGGLLTLSLLTALAGFSVWRWVSEYRTSLQLQRDLDEGLALWIRPHDSDRNPVEVLPHSRVLWWADHSPASWRTIGKRGPRR